MKGIRNEPCRAARLESRQCSQGSGYKPTSFIPDRRESNENEKQHQNQH